MASSVLMTNLVSIHLFADPYPHSPTANLVLEDTVERIYHANAFAENWHGLFLIRGENVVLLGEIVRFIPTSYSHHQRPLLGP
jgi:hypothetical protein